MFTLPPRPPKDHILREIPQTQVSSDAFTPFAPPRVTQSNLGRFCYPVEYSDNEVPEKRIESLAPSVLDSWTDKARVFWVDAPGKNAYYLHDIYTKYRTIVEDTYDPRFKPKAEQVFNRSYKYELDCREQARLRKLEEKVARERAEWEELWMSIERKEKAKEKPPFRIQPCKQEPPFWWTSKEPGENEPSNEVAIGERQAKRALKIPFEGASASKRTVQDHQEVHVRWQEEPDLIRITHLDPCIRKKEMALVGQPFRTEACNWYYKNYPTAKLKMHHKPFGG